LEETLKQIGRIAIHVAVCLAVTVLWGVEMADP
jgi:hypothetical protein